MLDMCIHFNVSADDCEVDHLIALQSLGAARSPKARRQKNVRFFESSFEVQLHSIFLLEIAAGMMLLHPQASQFLADT